MNRLGPVAPDLSPRPPFSPLLQRTSTGPKNASLPVCRQTPLISGAAGAGMRGHARAVPRRIERLNRFVGPGVAAALLHTSRRLRYVP